METSFVVGAIFEITDRATPTLGRLGEAFAGLDAKIGQIQEKLAAFGRDGGLFSGVMAGVQELGSAIEGLGAKATAAADAMERAFSRGAAAATAAARDINAAADSMGVAADRMGGFGAGGGGPSVPFNPEAYERRPLLPFATGIAVDRVTGGGGRAGGPGWSWGEFEEGAPLRLSGPRGPGGGGGFPPRDEPFDPRLPLNYQQGGRGGHLGALVEAAAVYEAMKAGAQEEQSIDIALLRGFGIDPRRATDEQKGALRSLAARAAEGTSFSEREVAGGMPVLAAPLGFQGPEGLAQFTAIFEVAAKAAEAAKQLKFGTYEGSLAGAVEFAHQMRAYKPEELQPAMNRLGAITETLPHGDMEREALVMGYVIPQARALGADPMEAMTAVGFLQQSGLRNTVAATTLRQMLIGQMKSGGPLGAQIDHEKQQFEHDLRLEPGHLRGRGKAGSEHEKALRDLGLTNAAGGLQDLNAKGGVDIDKMLSILAKAQEHMTPVEFGKSLYGAFGVRGETGGAIIAEALPQYRAYQQRVAGTAPLDEQLKMIQGNAVQLTGQAVARVADLGNEIGTTLLPTLKAFDDAIITATGFLRGLAGLNPAATAAVAGGGIAASIVGGVMAMRALPHWISKLFTEGSAEQASGAVRGIGPRISNLVGGGGLFDTFGELIAPLMIGADVQRHLADPKYLNPKTGEFDIRRVVGMPTGDQGSPGQKPDLLSNSVRTTPAPPAAPANVTVTIGSVTVPPEMQAWYDGVVSKLKDAIKSGLEHASSSPTGTDMSPYTQGYGF